MTLQEIDSRLRDIETVITDDNADFDALYSEVKELKAERSALIEANQKRRSLLDDIAAGRAETTPLASFGSVNGAPIMRNAWATPPAITRDNLADKVIFRSGEKLSAKFASDVDADKCIRAAITGNRDELSEAEKRAVTPMTGGAMLSPEVSSILIDNFRQSDWMKIFQPSIISMRTGEVKIPNITALPTAVMHTPGAVESTTDPTIDAVVLTAKTIMVLVEVANELLQDSATSQGIIIQACSNALANKLLQQVLYGSGTSPEMKGVTTYPTTSFADAGDKSTELDLFRLVTMAKMAIIRNNGGMNAMLYDCNLEDRLNKRLATGELVQPCRAFTELYNAGKVMAHPSVAAGDMLFMQADALFMGFTEEMKIEVDPYSAFNSNNTKFRLITRGDVFANAAKMVYYSAITDTEPTA